MATQLANTQPGQINPLVTLRHELEQRANEFRMALPAHISPEKFQRTILTAVQSNPKLLQADRRSFITSCMKAAQDGLLPDGREAALVEFKTRQKDNGGNWVDVRLVQYMPMAFGIRKKILQSGEVKDLFASVVYRQEIDAGLFIYEEGTERMLRHKPLLDPEFDPKDEDIVAAYSIATLDDGTKVFEVMRRSEINKVRQMSQTGALGQVVRFGNDKGKLIEPKGPWVDWFAEMAKKTVIRRHSKTLPMSGDLIDVEAMDDAAATRSATALLGSTEADAPTPSLPRRDDFVDEVNDEETGEIIEGQATAGAAQEQPQEEKPKQQRKPRAPKQDVQEQPAETVTLAAAKAEIDSAELIPDVNSRVSRLLPQLSEEDGNALRSHAIEKIEKLKGNG